MNIVNYGIEEIDSKGTTRLNKVSVEGAEIRSVGSTKEVRMNVLSKILLAVMAGAALFAAPGSARQRTSPNGMLDQVVVVARAPEQLRGTMPEVVVAAQVPEHARGLLPEVAVVADGPVLMLDEVVVVAQAPETESARDVLVVMHEARLLPERIN